MRIHSRAETNSAPRSAIRPMRLMDASCTFSCRLRRMGVMRGTVKGEEGQFERRDGEQNDVRRSFTGGLIWVIPTTLAMAAMAAIILWIGSRVS